MSSTGQLEKDGWRSAQVSDDQEHKDAGQQHPSDHDELILGGSSFYKPHHRIRETQHVGNIQHLLMCPLWSKKVPQQQQLHDDQHNRTILCSLSALIHLILGVCRGPPWRATPSEVSHDGDCRAVNADQQSHPDKKSQTRKSNSSLEIRTHPPTHFKKAQEQWDNCGHQKPSQKMKFAIPILKT